MKRNVLTIFLASPSDLGKERSITKDSVVRLNQTLGRRIGWQIELLGWEDTLPGYSRPQQLINKDVDICELFIGILWKRWGQPTGEFTSGFSEEFSRACDRCKKTGNPEIWLYFKSIKDDLKKDPGGQLSNVLKFKEEQETKKELLFKEFKNSEEWEKLIYDDILAYMIDISKKEESSILVSSETISGTKQETVNNNFVEATKSNVEYPVLIKEIFAKANEFINGGKSIEFNIWEKTRLLLQAFSWYSLSHSGEYFGPHEANLVYKMRNNWVLSKDEEWFLLCTILNDNNDVIPGYFWFFNKEESFLDTALSYLSIFAKDDYIKRKAVTLLANSGFQADKSFIIRSLNTKDDTIIEEAINIALNNKKRKFEFVLLIENNIQTNNSTIRNKLIQARLEIMYERNPDQTFQYLLDNSIDIPQFFNDLIEVDKFYVNRKLLIEALKLAVPSVRHFTIKYLKKNKMLTKEICERLLKDTDSHIREEGVIGLINLGETIEIDFIKNLFPKPKKDNAYLSRLSSETEVKVEDLLPIVYSKHDPQELLDSLNFYIPNGDIIYKVLAENHFHLIEKSIRRDLDDEFESFREESILKLLDKYCNFSLVTNNFIV